MLGRAPRILVPNCSLHHLHGLHCSHGLHLMALIAWPSSHGFIVLGRAKGARLTRPRHPPFPKLLTSSPSWSSSLSWPSSHVPHRMAVIAWLHCAWQGQGRLTSQKAAARHPVPSCSLHRLHGLHRSHGLHRMALIAWLHRAWKGKGARLTSQKAAAPAPTPHILVPNCSLHRLHGHRMASSCLAGPGCSVDYS